VDESAESLECGGAMQNPQEVKRQVGIKVRRLRKQRGWNQEELAHEAGIGRSFVGAIETGAKDLRISTLVKLANVFGITVAGLLK